MKSKRAKLNAIRYTPYAILAGCLLTLSASCENGGGKPSSLAEEINALREEKKQLAHQIEQSKAENKQLRKQMEVLAELPPEAKLENLYRLRSVKIGRYTGFYDKDKDGKKEKLIVYIKPIDEEGDIVKATGAVDVQLWDLSREQGEALLGEWRVEPDELKELWFAAMITTNYRLTFDVAEIIEGVEEPLTVKMTFSDYLTGKVFKEQKVIEPRL